MSLSIRVRDLIERVVSTTAEAALGVVTAAGFNLINLESWQGVAVAAGSAALYSVLKALAAFKIGDPDTASLNPNV